MKRKRIYLLLGTMLGVVLSLAVCIPIATFVWFENNPSQAEMRTAVAEFMTLSAEELDEVERMMFVGAIIDLAATILLYAFPAALLGGLFGCGGGFLYARRQHQRETPT